MAFIKQLNLLKSNLCDHYTEAHELIEDQLSGNPTPAELEAIADWIDEAYRSFQNAPKPPGYEPPSS